MHGKCGVLQVLLKEGVELGVVDRRQWCAVHHAAFHGRLGILQVSYHGWPDSLGGVQGSASIKLHERLGRLQMAVSWYEFLSSVL